ncbi:MAG: hemolysin family protein [Amylibacter sp.]|jgi:magnesium and cobalt transporter|nr:hemolysin family protein [Amylibacter sp.]MDA8802761.1 hemolysin family protein [Amylibacter sp.]MDB2676643.1 hemolysin family protein [Amylibacter sp.]MDG1947062.1 hemolysin family protein [Amylibacter sp.]RZO42285.1 MAG: HlyC/CorC family transporter [Paracoccaceae bacterium]|tara:strand:- start:108 stop:965 length:858 start_codon:yes stop_codon:yes gene_type:complete
MGDIKKGSLDVTQGAQLSQKNIQSGFFKRLLSGVETPKEQLNQSESSLPDEGISKLKTLRVEDVAIPRADIVSVSSELDSDALIKEFRDSGYSRLPVFEDTLDNPIGMVHLKDLALKYIFDNKSEAFNFVELVRPVLFVPPSMPLDVLLQKMQTERTHMALVVDEYGGVDGLATIEDLVEQLVGNISDEHDTDDDATWFEVKPDVYICQSRASLEEFEKVLGVDLASDTDDEEIDTMGGLVFMMTGRVPVRGEVISHPSGYDFEVIEADPRRIKKLRVSQKLQKK